MREEVRDLYLLMLGMKDVNEFQGKFGTWPRNHKEYWYKGYIIEYENVLRFLDKIYAERGYGGPKRPV